MSNQTNPRSASTVQPGEKIIMPFALGRLGPFGPVRSGTRVAVLGSRSTESGVVVTVQVGPMDNKRSFEVPAEFDLEAA